MFNLVDQPWIPVIWRERPKELAEIWSNGENKGLAREERIDDWRSEIGILDALNYAGQIREIYDTSPLVTFGIHRLLLAILHAANVHGESAAIQYGADKYLKDKRRRFDLFDKENPFFQDPDLSKYFPDDAEDFDRPVTDLFPERPSDSEKTHFLHTRDPKGAAPSTTLSAAECARGLATMPLFVIAVSNSAKRETPLQNGRGQTSGKGKPNALNGGAPVLAARFGATLTETLRLQLGQSSRQATGHPEWEKKTVTTSGDVPLAEGLTWQSRKALVRVGHNEDGTLASIASVVYDKGRSAQGVTWNDPFSTHGIAKKKKKDGTPSEKTEFVSLKDPTDVRHTLACSRTIVEHLARFPGQFGHLKDEKGKVAYRLRYMAVAADNAKIFDVSMDELTLRVFEKTNADRVEELSKSFDKLQKDVETRLGLRKKPKQPPFADRLPVFDFLRFEQFREDYIAQMLLDHATVAPEVRKIAGTCFHPAVRTRDGLPWRDTRDARPPTTRTPPDDDDKNCLKNFLNRLADKECVPLADLSLLRRARIHAGLDAAPLTDLLNEHVREFKGLHRRTAWVIARLFVHDPEQGRFGNMGEHLRSLRCCAVSEKARERLDWEFERLLYTPFNQLESALSRWIMRLRQARHSNPNKHQRVHWENLYQDLDGWGEEVRAKWRVAFIRKA